MKNFKALVKKANEEIAKVKTLLNDKADCFATRDLKLYDIAYNQVLQDKFSLTDDQYNQAFEWFCSDSYMFFEEWLEEERIDKSIMQYIGRTSSFNLIPQNGIVEFNRYDDINIEYSICEYISRCVSCCSNLDSLIDDIGEISLEKIRQFLSSVGNAFYCLTVEEAIASLKDDIEELTENILSEYEYALEDVEKVHNYLKGFQDNQVEYFEEFLENYVENYVA